LARATSVALAGVLGIGLLSPTAATAAEPATLPEIVRSVSGAGFSHPGIGMSAEHLENARAQVAAGVEPWASYYDAMRQTRYAAVGFTSTIQGPSDDAPLIDAYDNVAVRSKAHGDSIGAMTQALLYVMTGDERYRANALHVIRSWSSLNPAKYRYFTDSHIHTGVPLYQMLVAAEVIRATEPANAQLDGYDLRWSDRDEQRIEDNLVRPTVATFLFSQNRLWNQHLYGVIGMVAAGIFLDDADLYAERVEWFTVNSTYRSEHTINGGDVNGSLAAIMRIIDAEDPLNPYDKDFLQVMEMGRDQAHAEGDIDLLTALARVVNIQGTKLDPVAGTVSTAPDAVTPYQFLDNRVLHGGDAFAAFMMGEDLPWVDTSGGAGKVSQAYRGRLREPLNELYYQYKYVAGVDVEREAPHIAEMHEHHDGPLFYNGAGISNFWNESGSDFTGAEYWVAFPPELAQEDVTVAPPGDGPELPLARFGHTLGKGAKHLTDDAGESFVRLNASKDDAKVAVRRAVWPDRSGKALVGLRVRTNHAAVLEAARTSTDQPFARVHVPDTDGRWRYVWIDVASSKVPRIGDHIIFLRATGSRAHVDVTGVLANANGTLAPPVFGDGASLDVVAVAHEPYSRDLRATDPDGGFSLRLEGAPRGARLADDTLTWLPDTRDRGVARFAVVASDDRADTVLPVTVTVAPDRAAAIETLMSDLDERAAYTSSTWQPVAQAHAAAVEAVRNAEPAAFAALLETLRVAVGELQLLNPRLVDGTLDFSRLVSSPDLTPVTLTTLVDGDNQTFWGDIRRPSVLLDFGAGYRFHASAIGWLARDTFPDRSHGANAYGSNDGVTWTLLTERHTEGDDAAIETVPVRSEVRNQRFRYLKLQADEPQGAIFSMADLRIAGERTEVELAVLLEDALAHDLSGYSRASAILFSREIAAVQAAAAEPDADTRGLAVRVLAAWKVLEEPPFETADVNPAWVTASTPSWDGSKDAARNGWSMFDGDPTTFTDTRDAAGWVSVVPDNGTTFHIEAVRYTPRSTNISRSDGLRLQGSNDGGQTWQTFATTSGSTAGWNRIDLAAAVDTAAFRVLAGSGNTNLAEVELVTSTVDRSALGLYLTETGPLAESDWSADSWTTLVEARTAAQHVHDDRGAGQAAVDAAADALAAAVTSLKRR
jgi:hypothetical protein